MTDLSTALATKLLTPFEGRDVTRSRIEIPGAAGGLQDALDMEPVELHHGDTAYLLMEVETVKVRHDPIKDSDCLARVHVLKPVPGMTAWVDKGVAAKMLEEQRERIELAREEATGIMRLTGPDPTAKAGAESETPFGKAPETARADWDDEDDDEATVTEMRKR